MSRSHAIRLAAVASAVLALAPLGAAQLSWGGVPVSQQLRLPGVVPTLSMEPVDVGAFLAEDAQAGQGGPFRFGATLAADLGFEHGVWDVAPDGTRVWRLRLESQGAHSLGLLFSRYTLPCGASLFVYGDDWDDLAGAFDDRNNKADGEFSIAPVRGDAITLEYVEPPAVAATGGAARLRIGAVVHDYRDLYALLDGGQAGPADAPCDVDVNCPPGAGWQDEKRAVVLMLIGGSYCTGTLINNTAHDGTPYLITAEHCGGLNNAIFRFGYEKPECASGTAPTNKTVQGSELLASGVFDYRLVRLTSAIPASYEPYFLGWDRSGVDPVGAVTIHHGALQTKKISVEDDPVTKFGFSWHIKHWDVGTIEGGSSGSPLMPSSGRFIGQLSYGIFGCADPVAYFNRLDTAWAWLEPWLDPAGTGALAIDGHDPYAAPVLPVLDAVSPATVQAFQGGTLTLTGSDLAGITQVSVGDVAITSGFTATPTTVTLPAPDAETLGSARVTVAASGGTSEPRTFTYVETSPPKLINTGSIGSPAGVAAGGQPWPFQWAAGGHDTALLVYAFTPDTFEHAGHTILSDFAIGVVKKLPANGIGGVTVRAPEGFVFVTVWTQVLALHETGGFAGASPITSTMLVP
jgi:hypothetical protein